MLLAGAAACTPPTDPGEPPVVVAGPAARVVPVGTVWTQRVTALGSDLRYQWRRNGLPIPGATAAAFEFRLADPGAGGMFDVVVSNRAGAATSDAVEMRVVGADGPWVRDLRIAVATAPDEWAGFTTFLPSAGVVSLARRPSGQLLAAFQWFPLDDLTAFDRVAVRSSPDGGRTWGPPAPVTIEGFPAGLQRPFDPTLAITPDGRVRLYFTSGAIVPPGQPQALGFYSAISTDGVSYTFEPGVRFHPGTATVDCAVLWHGDLWHLVSPVLGSPSLGAYHATSADGLSFTRLPDIPGSATGSWIGNLVAVGGVLRFYGGSPQGLWHASYLPGGGWSARTTLVELRGGDPAVIEAEPGRWLLIVTS